MNLNPYLKLDLEVAIDRVDYHLYDGKMIQFRGTVARNHELRLSMAEAVQVALDHYFDAMDRISKDGP